jgi:xylulokinase
MLAICGITEKQLPRLFESAAPVGTLKPDVAAELGLPQGVVVCAGAGDNAAAAVGTGVVGEGGCNISLGTSGTVFSPAAVRRGPGQRAALLRARGRRLSPHGLHPLGGLLQQVVDGRHPQNAGLRRRAGADLRKGPGRNHVYYLPYLMGERSPHNDPAARSAFVGMTMDTTRAQMTQAVLEGVAFAIRDCVEVARAQGIAITASRICGGGAKSPLWRRSSPAC